MATRIIRDGILSSERIAVLGWAEEVFYRRLMSVADDYGRYYAHPSLLRAACYPLHLNKVSDSDIGKWLTACVSAALVRVYPAKDGKRYLEIQDFGQRVQGKPKFPDPQESTESHGESPGNCALDGDGDVIEDEGVGGRSDAEKVLAAYHAALPACQQISVLNDKRKKRIAAAVKLARQVCKSQGWTYSTADFWAAYFSECAQDEWLRGDKPNPKNLKWRQNLDVLLAEDRFAEIMDKTIASMRGGA